MIVIVCGGRDFTDRNFLFQTLDRIHKERTFTKLIEGGQRTRDKHTRELVGGADYFAMRWAKRTGIPFETVMADWDKYGKGAGPIRNSQMLTREPKLVIAFPGKHGTADMIRQTKAANIELIEIEQ